MTRGKEASTLRAPAIPRRTVWLLAGALVLAYLLGRTLPVLDDDVHVWFRWWGGIALYATAGGLCLVRAAHSPRDRAAWLLLGAGIFAYGSGSAITRLSDGGPCDAPFISHVGWMSFYAAA